MKKILSIALALALCLTAMMGCFVVSAAANTLAVGTADITVGDATADVVVDITSEGVWAIRFDVKSDVALTAVAIDDANFNAELEGTKVLVQSVANDYANNITAAKITLTFATADLAAGSYAVAIENIDAGNYAEAPVAFDTTAGAIVVAEAVVEPAEPVEITNKLIAPSLLMTEAAASEIGINVSAKNGLTTLGYADYYLEITYDYYASGYVLDTKTITLQPEDAYRTTGTVDYFLFDKIALYEMPLEYTVKLCLLDDKGAYVAYNTATTSVQKLALAYANKYSTDAKLLTALVDMVNYGAAIQEFFASTNSGSDIDGAALPNVGFEAYADYASDASDLPDSFNNTNTTKNPTINPDVVVTNQIKNVASVIVGASNSIEFKFQAKAEYTPSQLTAVISYTNAYGNVVSETVSFADMAVSNYVYTTVFTKLALYDLDETVHVSILNNGTEQLSFDYSVGNYVNQYIGNAAFTEVFTAMELFAQSARAKLVG